MWERDADAITPRMTYMTVTYELQNALKPEQFRALGQFANTCRLQKFHFDEKTNHLQFDYDAEKRDRVCTDMTHRRTAQSRWHTIQRSIAGAAGVRAPSLPVSCTA